MAKTIEDIIRDKFGDVLFGGNIVAEAKNIVIPVSPSIDIMLGGGIPEGSLTIVTGLQKLGKTSLCLHFAGNAQNIKYANEMCSKEGRHVYFFNVEGRIKSRDLLGIKHLNIDESRFTIIGSKLGKILTAEDYIDIAEKLINEKPGSIFIFDSFSALCTEEEYTAEIGKKRRDNTPQLLAMFCRRISNVLPVNKSIFMGITHLMANQGFGMTQWTEASGQKLKYAVDVKLRAKYCQPWKVGETQIGQDVYWECDSSAIGPPGGKAKSKLRYGYGLDCEAELIDFAVDLGLIEKKTSWYTYGEDKAQGLENMRAILLEKPEKLAELDKQVREMYNISMTQIIPEEQTNENGQP